MMRESVIEKYLAQEVKKIGGIAVKLQLPVGIPDRMLLIGSQTVFVELKTARGKLSLLQLYWQRKLTKMGFQHYVIRSKAGVDALISLYEIS